jgi:hypothetical protein
VRLAHRGTPGELAAPFHSFRSEVYATTVKLIRRPILDSFLHIALKTIYSLAFILLVLPKRIIKAV